MIRNMIKYDNGCFLQASFQGGEVHLMIHADASESFDNQLNAIHEAFSGFMESESEGARPVFMRYFLSDAANQAHTVSSFLDANQVCAVSVLEQPPLDGSKVALWVYLMKDVEVTNIGAGLWEVRQGDLRHLWMGGSFVRGGDSESQMRVLFENYIASLQANGCTLSEDCIRTWIFVQNVDVNYAGIVKARREVFEDEGLTAQTHYIASTGIAGRNAYPDSSVIMDAYAVAGLAKDQIRYIYGSTHLNPTYEYGVTFERGTAVDYPDRRQVFISGTASIDNKGQIVHPGNVSKQCERLLENVSVLLSEAECGFEDVMSMIVYLRDISDYQNVRHIFDSRYPDIPKIYLWAPVCRPGWLVEMECIALKRLQ